MILLSCRQGRGLPSWTVPLLGPDQGEDPYKSLTAALYLPLLPDQSSPALHTCVRKEQAFPLVQMLHLDPDSRVAAFCDPRLVPNIQTCIPVRACLRRLLPVPARVLPKKTRIRMKGADALVSHPAEPQHSWSTHPDPRSATGSCSLGTGKETSSFPVIFYISLPVFLWVQFLSSVVHRLLIWKLSPLQS